MCSITRPRWQSYIMGGLENLVKQKLDIKWIDARRLVQEAQVALGIAKRDVGERQDEVLEEALEIFEDLPPEEQDEMRAPEEVTEPEWKRKAREQAEKREQEWAAAAQKIKDAGPVPPVVDTEAESEEEEPIGRSSQPLVTSETPWTTTSTTRTATKTKRVIKPSPTGIARDGDPIQGGTVYHKTVCCVIL